MGTRTIKRTPAVIGLAIVSAITAGAIVAFNWNGEGDRQRVVAERGAEVMPFDLDATTHHFEPTDDGGVQTVTADDPTDDEEVRLIREHLQAEAEAFSRGDFDDPAQIHGDEMPGLATLEANAERIDVEYAETETGARIRYTTDEPELISALHDWFAAQTSDHGDHAR